MEFSRFPFRPPATTAPPSNAPSRGTAIFVRPIQLFAHQSASVVESESRACANSLTASSAAGQVCFRCSRPTTRQSRHMAFARKAIVNAPSFTCNSLYFRKISVHDRFHSPPPLYHYPTSRLLVLASGSGLCLIYPTLYWYPRFHCTQKSFFHSLSAFGYRLAGWQLGRASSAYSSCMHLFGCAAWTKAMAERRGDLSVDMEKLASCISFHLLGIDFAFTIGSRRGKMRVGSLYGVGYSVVSIDFVSMAPEL